MPGLEQPTLFDFSNNQISPLSDTVINAIEELASNNSIESRGAIYTKSKVVDFILNLVGYNPQKPLFKYRILEPSFGNGDFLFIIVDRLLNSWKNSCDSLNINILLNCIQAVELHKKTYENTRYNLIKRLTRENIPKAQANILADSWLVQGDFLLEPQNIKFDYIVGNPPYVRQELIPSPLLEEYRHRFNTMCDRADLYIPFIEKSLSLLKKEGMLGFICADRWMKNRYGKSLRKIISNEYGLKIYVDMSDTPAFFSEVSAYPAITIISGKKSSKTRIIRNPKLDKQILTELAQEALSPNLDKKSIVTEANNVVNGSEPWLLESNDQINLIRRIEKQYPKIEETGCKVGIGVATGADKIFIRNYNSLNIEEDRKLPLVGTRDIQTGKVAWRGKGIINPFTENGKLVNLKKYPKLADYLEKHKATLIKRHCAKKSPQKWYRTIDRIWPVLTQKPKLLIPDIKGEAHIVLESGNLYPHHNLYYITSETWNLRALQAILLSSISKLFISTYSTKIRGGYLRFQAQHIRRIRTPYWKDVSESLRNELINAAINRDTNACNHAVFKLYKLSQDERAALGGN
jgi:hypothetical protein